jgi:7-keto-8-aminopelargonate synthetase-like enzyme
MENWQKRKIDRSLKYQTRVFSEHINELVAVKRDGKVITLDDGRKMVEFVSCSYLGLETHPALKKRLSTPLSVLACRFLSPERG